jgi:pyruvate carboxylase
MPGMISTIATKVGQAVKSGDILMTIEAMKMEAAGHAARDGLVRELLVERGSTVDAKDLIAVLD